MERRHDRRSLRRRLDCRRPAPGRCERFLDDLKERFAKFALDLHPDKTRLIVFGRFIAGERRARGEGRPETFDFLGFTHICGVKQSKAETGRSSFPLLRRTRRKRKWATIQTIKLELQRIRHDPIDEQGRRLASMLKGHYAYFAVPTNIDAVCAVRDHVWTVSETQGFLACGAFGRVQSCVRPVDAARGCWP